MEIDEGTARVLGVDRLLALWRPSSPAGVVAARRWWEREAPVGEQWWEEIQALRVISKKIAGRATAVKRIQEHLAELPLLEKSLRRLRSQEVLEDTHLFEVKRFLFAALQVIEAAQEIRGVRDPQSEEACALRALMAAIHPEEVPTARFALSDKLDARLGETRGEFRRRRREARRLRASLEGAVCQVLPGRFDVHGVFYPEGATEPEVLQALHLRERGSGLALIHPDLDELVEGLSALERAVGVEEERLRESLTERIRQEQTLLESTAEELLRFDLLLSRAVLREELQGCWPEELGPESRAHLVLRRGGSPFLEDPQRIDATLEAGATVVVGPNMGGKSSFLKLLGLCFFCAARCLPVPAQTFQFRRCDRVVYVGSDQHEEESPSGLSSFGREVERLVRFWGSEPPTLWLLDEPARGTHPEEGAALARRVVETLRSRGDRLVVATHFPELAEGGYDLLQLRGLEVSDEVLEEALRAGTQNEQPLQETLQGLMNYSLVPVANGEVPRDAARVARALGLRLDD